MTPVETLQGMRDLLADPRRWTQGERALDVDGLDAEPTGEAAVCWCIVGAFQKVASLASRDIYREFGADPAGKYLQVELDRKREFFRPWAFNDYRTHPEVIALIDAALTNAKKDSNA